MKIRRVEIENFRSIRKLVLEPQDYCVLIGENNSGKSNILRALTLVLGEFWPSERAFSEDDFHKQDTSVPISIRVFFDEVTTTWRNNSPSNVGGFELTCKAYKKRVKNRPAGSLKVDYTCIEAGGKRCTYPPEPLTKGQQVKGHWPELRVSADLREKLPLVYVDVLREYGRQSPRARWSVLRRLFERVNKELASDKKLIKVPMPDGSTAEMTRKLAFEHAIQEAYQYLRTDTYQKIEQQLAKNTREQMGIDEGDVSLQFQSHDPTNAYKSLELFVEEQGITTPAGEVGSGLQSAIVLAIFRTYQELQKEGAVFAIEEPEVFLHPHKARFFATLLRSLSETGNQVFATTHSPVFVDLAEPETLAVIRRDAEQGTQATTSTKVELAKNERSQLRLLSEFDSQRNELFFAKNVLLVEGATEKLAFPLLFKARGVDLNRAGISVVECGGKTKIPLFARVCTSLQIPFVAVADNDIRELKGAGTRKEIERNQKHEKWNADLVNATQGGQLILLEPDFEGVADLPRTASEKLDNVIEWAAALQWKDLPQALQQCVEAVLEQNPAKPPDVAGTK